MDNRRFTQDNCFNYTVSDFTTLLRSFLDLQGRYHDWGEVSQELKIILELVAFKIDKLYKDCLSALGIAMRHEEDVDDEEMQAAILRSALQTRRGVKTLSTSEALKNVKISKMDKKPDAYFKQNIAQTLANSSDMLLLSRLRVSKGLNLILDSQNSNEWPPSSGEAQLNLGLKPSDIEAFTAMSLCSEYTEIEQEFFEVPMALDAEEELERPSDRESDSSDTDFHAVQDSYELETSHDLQTTVCELSNTLRDFLINHDYIFHNCSNPGDWAGFAFYRQKSKNTAAGRKKRISKKEQSRVSLRHIDEDIRQPENASSNSVNLSETALRKWSMQNILPEDHRVSFEHLTRMFSRPQTQIKLIRDDHTNVLVDNYPSDPLNEGAADDQGDESISLLYAQAGTEPIPEIVRQKEAKSWRQSNYVDMRKVKRKVRVLASSMDSFSSIIESLPQSLDENETGKMSFSLCFVTLLHLAEKNRKRYTDLTFEQKNDLDFKISKGGPI